MTPQATPPHPPGATLHLGGSAWAHPTVEGRLVPIGDVTPYPGNPRRGDQDAITSSIRDLGLYAGIVVQRSTGHIVVGNHRRHALVELGAEQVPVDYLDVDDTRSAAIVARDNRTSELGGYDDADLLALLTADEDVQALSGYDDEAVAALRRATAEVEQLTDPDAAPEPPVSTPISRDGDVWRLGPHRLVVGDAREEDAYARLLDGQRVACVWTDPPYGVSIVGGSHAIPPSERRKRGGKVISNDGTAGLADLLRAALPLAADHSAVGAAWYVAYADKAVLPFLQVLADLGIYRQNIAWVKDSLVLGQADYHSRYEPIAYGWKPGAARLHPVEDRTQTTVWEIPRPKRSEHHPTMKPVELVARALRNSTRPGDLVLDPFAGSGTTLIACHQEDRTARLIELDPAYADVICRRYQQHTGTLPVRDGEQVDFTEAT